ncbi:hypothetical protein BAUCODRAFT_401652 [Baudoinia panamericana UAMH 10762]|uniref:Uncharacterized protein n=1 Tax=Baudoinia panamericana (strain UAMH 10762) TaxID=717646 RepID=M2NJR5_BAUPA|nr:uncharacterized protein BAUCODRAFT_401652 [Baudoinia panamericana UAMH 10762]EMC99385.1 hypothetical protein BAUCODRAFT_401652 [Baudoinia panamericana UAMH 10762]
MTAAYVSAHMMPTEVVWHTQFNPRSPTLHIHNYELKLAPLTTLAHAATMELPYRTRVERWMQDQPPPAVEASQAQAGQPEAQEAAFDNGSEADTVKAPSEGTSASYTPQFTHDDGEGTTESIASCTADHVSDRSSDEESEFDGFGEVENDEDPVVGSDFSHYTAEPTTDPADDDYADDKPIRTKFGDKLHRMMNLHKAVGGELSDLLERRLQPKAIVRGVWQTKDLSSWGNHLLRAYCLLFALDVTVKEVNGVLGSIFDRRMLNTKGDPSREAATKAEVREAFETFRHMGRNFVEKPEPAAQGLYWAN